MLNFQLALLTAASSSNVLASTLDDLCTSNHAIASLPSNDVVQGIAIDRASVTAAAFQNISVSGQNMYPDAVFDYCNVTFAYSHKGCDDRVLVTYWMPSPSSYRSRFLATGGGGYAINSGNMSLPGGVIYGAASGLTDGGFGGFDNNVDTVSPQANGSTNWQAVYMFGYQAIHEMTLLGKAFTRNFYPSVNNTLFTYYQGCSEGGREGWSQVQRYGDQFDGAVIGAPAIRYAFQQVQHLYSGVVEQSLDYYPPTCELMKIVNETLKHCDSLDGKTDGVVSRTDLCKLSFNVSSVQGMPYDCPATPANPITFTPAAPAQNGTVSEMGINVAQLILDGLHDSAGKRVYIPYQPTATFVDAETQYDTASSSFQLMVSSLGGEWVERWIKVLNASNLPDLNGVTVDTLKHWTLDGLHTYEDSLQTTWPDLSAFHAAGGKILHYHGESDNSIPTASSVRYHESVRKMMYPGQSYNASTEALNEWYKLFLVPGAAHCSPDPNQPNGAFPQTNLAVLIDWVENGVEPATLNATVLQGQHQGANQQTCAWPLRPLWEESGMFCVYDQDSIDTWHYDLDAIKLPVY